MAVAKGKSVDASFARKMIAHHEGAIDMSKIELEHGADAKTKQMAQKVIDESNPRHRRTAGLAAPARRLTVAPAVGSTLAG